jgi:hypothetical protein
MMMTQSDNRQMVVAALAVLRDGDEAASIADYLADDDREACLSLIESYGAGRNRRERCESLVRQLVASERFSSLAEVHPAWIVEHLRDESPRVIGIIMRSLPSEHVRYLLKNLPPMVREQIPNMVESFAVAAPVLEVIRSRFERHFLPMRVSRAAKKLGFGQLYYLKGQELQILIRELGLTELGLALAGLTGKTLRAVFNRLDLKDAKRLQGRMRELAGASKELKRQARYTVLEVEGSHVGPDRMLMRIGLAALASAMGTGDSRLVSLIKQKLPPSDSWLLKRSIDERAGFHQGLSAERQALILALASGLAKDGRIDPFFSRFLADEEDTTSRDVAAPDASDEEETATVQQLA